MTPAPDRIAILLPIGVAVTMTFSTVIIQALALMGIIHFVLRRAGVQFLEGRGDHSWSCAGRTCSSCGRNSHVGCGVQLCGEFSQLARAAYHSGMNYTTLGDTDTVMSPSWRLLAPLEAANDMLMWCVNCYALCHNSAINPDEIHPIKHR
jgi:hypothetical protein